MTTAKYVLENGSGERFDLTAPANIFLVNVEGLGATSNNSFADLGAGFFLQTDDRRPQNSIQGDLIYQSGAYANYQTLVDFILGASELWFCYTPLETEYRRPVRLANIGKARRDGAGWMRASVTFDPLAPWSAPTPGEPQIQPTSATSKAYLDHDGVICYIYTDELAYGGASAGGMEATILPDGHEPSGIVFRYHGAIANPRIRLVGQSTGTVYGICDIAYTLSAADTLELCTEPNNSYVRRITSSGESVDLLPYCNLLYDPFPRAPVTETSVVSIESDAAVTGTAELLVVAYYRSV